ncbi:phosphatase PAP2 family protein [uncultured Alistipes sp.]|uniref:phosphatase PAP2 family protein n=1 Tax=uncultured Alistipes sp. TaxID=538949 RepID=UPI00261A37A7|nr:phosphatase PAP2 family protein [uncultured Alistipes sp.]
MYYDFDHPLFLALNFDGGPAMDRAMLLVSGTPMWLPLYALILWLVWRRTDWRLLLLFIGCMAAALVLADMICGIFKHVGVLKEVWPSFPPRLRPMFTPELEGMNVSADSLAVIRRTAVPGDWAVHVLPETATGRYGTVSAHAAVIAALAALACPVVRRRWFTLLMIAATLLICYSRIYLAKHFPVDLLLGAATGALTGGAAYALFRALSRRKA